MNLNTIANAFGLTNGNDYSLDVFQAERHTVASNFTMTTSLLLETAGVPEPTTLALLGLGLAGLGIRRRK